MRRAGVLALLLLSGLACRGPDELAVSPWYGTGQSSWSNEGRDFASHNSGLMLTVSWSLGKRHEAYRNLAALDVSKAGHLALRDDHHDAAAVIVQVEGDETEIPEASIIDPFTKVPETLDEALLLGIYAIILAGLVIALKRAGLLYRFLPSKKDPKP